MHDASNKYNNYAFIDAQNLYKGIEELGWKLDYKRFFVYLREKYKVDKALLFLGYIEEREPLYKYLRSCGFELVFKETSRNKSGLYKGNVDIVMAMHVLVMQEEYKQAVFVTSDGDFAPLVEYLLNEDKFKVVLSPRHDLCSWLLRKYAKGRVNYLDESKDKLSETKKRP